MPKILLALGAVAIIAFWIGFYAARHPIVWETTSLPVNSAEIINSAGPNESSQSSKAAEPIVTGASHTSVPSLPVDDFNEKPINGESLRGNVEVSPASICQTEPLTKLVAVPVNLLIGRGDQPAEKNPVIRRLPPVNQADAFPPGRYAAEYPQSPIIMYPSTGVE